jgi:hypothetical protein
MKAEAQVDSRATQTLSRVDDQGTFMLIDIERQTFNLFVELLLTRFISGYPSGLHLSRAPGTEPPLEERDKYTEKRADNAEHTGKNASEVCYPNGGYTDQEYNSKTGEDQATPPPSPLLLLTWYLYCHMWTSSTSLFMPDEEASDSRQNSR